MNKLRPERSEIEQLRVSNKERNHGTINIVRSIIIPNNSYRILSFPMLSPHIVPISCHFHLFPVISCHFRSHFLPFPVPHISCHCLPFPVPFSLISCHFLPFPVLFPPISHQFQSHFHLFPPISGPISTYFLSFPLGTLNLLTHFHFCIFIVSEEIIIIIS